MEDKLEVTTSIREEDYKTQVNVVVPAEKVQEFIDAEYKELRKTRIPGFRPGRAPRPVVEQQFGGREAIMAHITEEMINELAPQACDEAGIIFISQIEFNESETIVEGEPYEFSLYAKVVPEVQLLTYDPVEITMPPAEATEAEIDAQVEQLRSYYYDFNDVEGRAVEAADYVSVKLACTANGEAVQGLNSDERLVELGQSILPVDLEAEIIGMNIGESKEVDFSVEGEADYEYIGADEVHAEITLLGIKEKVAAQDDDKFAETLGLESMQALRDMLKEAIDNQKTEQMPNIKERRCLEALALRIHGEVPVAYTNFTRQDVLTDFYRDLNTQGMTLDTFLAQQNITSEQFQEDVETEAKEVAEQGLALDALFKELGMEVTEEDIAAEFAVTEDPEATRAEWEKAGRISEIRMGIRRQKALKWLVDTAIVSEETEEEDED